jgi:hypothetical protein
MITIDQLQDAVLQHGTIYFDANLNPVVPQMGKWFVELTLDVEDGRVVEGDIVEIVDVNDDGLQGTFALVAAENEDECRVSRADVLILQV